MAEARQQGVRLLLSLVNNLQACGGKTQYFKNYALLTRKNTISGIEYRDDPTVFGWELINDPTCTSDASGDTLKDWIEEMLKSIDRKHLLTVGLEGFYGPENAKRTSVKPGPWAAQLGSDFIRNSKISNIDFASVRIYPDHWFHNHNLGFEEKLKYVSKWTRSHIEDGNNDLKKPITFTEFGLSTQNSDFEPAQCIRFYKTILDIVYKSAKRGGAGAGTFIWQFIMPRMEEFNEDFGFVPNKTPSVYKMLTEQTCKAQRCRSSTQCIRQITVLTEDVSTLFYPKRLIFLFPQNCALVTSTAKYQYKEIVNYQIAESEDDDH